MHSVVSVEEKLPVVVGVDDVPDGLQIVDIAATEAARVGVPLRIVHAWPGRHGGMPRHRALRPDPADGRHLLDLASLRARRVAPGVTVRTELADDSAAEALIRHSGRAGLLVLRHRDESTLGHGWGSTAAYVAHHSHCPLLVFRGATGGQGPVVVATSGRPTATVGSAFEAASRAGCPLAAAHVWTTGSGDDDTERRSAEERMRRTLARAARTWPDVIVNRLLLSDADVPYTVERASRRGRLLVAGRGHKGWLVEMLYHIGRSSPSERRLCPVLLIPPGWSGVGLPRATVAGTSWF
ncbi:universal stress protein [Actinoplanes italicus]|uniref:Nucleotide-binding universal stress UspA family protein n=1 Tax=Actinoplanes italicus TaxID=113567 RepID=A0A2T0KEP1_9ACTN|nr:universal stress protein [Actinoplanes italicus]PRX21853.1 nucleotide-binding universal stress UspA family protein [Actinoplanes italicus]GIE29730.1 universal stress protein [Actinoplanes italicus]